jgi:hypothetical protein
MPRTDDLVSFDGATGEAAAVVGTDILDGKELAPDVEDRDEDAVHFRRGIVARQY